MTNDAHHGAVAPDPEMVIAEEHRLERLFHELDTNKDGRVDPEELTTGLRRMGYVHITPEQIKVRSAHFRHSRSVLI